MVFDVNETLTDLSALEEIFARFGLGAHALAWWFAVVLRDGFALAAAGDTAAFGELVMMALDEVAAASRQHLPRDAGRELVDAFAQVPLHPDVRPALELLASEGVPAFALTYGSADLARRILDIGGVLESFVDVLSVDAVGHWKPRPEPYETTATRAGVPPARLTMVAVHPWDLHGAACAGLATGWVNREGRIYPLVFHPPTVQSTSLDDVVERLLSMDVD